MAINRVYRRLVEAFRTASRQHREVRRLYIEEDDFCQIELLPASAAEWCAGQMRHIEHFAKRHEVPGAMGWTDMYVRPPAPATLQSLAIPFDAATAAVGRLLPAFDEVVTGSPSEPIFGAKGYGLTRFHAVAFGRDPKDGAVNWIDITLHSGGREAEALLEALAAIPSPEPLMLADWVRGAGFALGDERETQRYLEGLGG